MAGAGTYAINPGWRVILADLGLSPGDLLCRAGLPGDLLARERASLTTEEYFRLWRALEEEARDPRLPIRIGGAISVEAFDPPIFAALCSSDLATALGRIATYKRLTCPMTLHLEARPDALELGIEWHDASAQPPAVLVAAELVFFVALARIATRTEVRPLAVRAPMPLEPAAELAAWLGVEPRVRPGGRPEIAFSSEDARRPFLTANEKMWRFFEPDLQRRLAELDAAAGVTDRVRAALVELLPGGAASVEAVAARLGTSSRTLQRRLQEEGASFQGVLARTREELAGHYLRSSALSTAEISFLLGFEDPNSFFRAFQAWTGTTPERARGALRQRH